MSGRYDYTFGNLYDPGALVMKRVHGQGHCMKTALIQQAAA